MILRSTKQQIVVLFLSLFFAYFVFNVGAVDQGNIIESNKSNKPLFQEKSLFLAQKTETNSLQNASKEIVIQKQEKNILESLSDFVKNFWKTIISRDIKTKEGEQAQAMSAGEKITTTSRNTGLLKVGACNCPGNQVCNGSCTYQGSTLTCSKCEDSEPDPPPEGNACPSDCPYCGCGSGNSCDYSCDDADEDDEGDSPGTPENTPVPAGSTVFNTCPAGGIKMQYAQIGTNLWYSRGEDFVLTNDVRQNAPYVALGQAIKSRVVDQNGNLLPVDNPGTTTVEGYKMKIQYDVNGGGGTLFGAYPSPGTDWYVFTQSTTGKVVEGTVATTRATGLSKARVWLDGNTNCVAYSGYIVTNNACPPNLKIQYAIVDTDGFQWYPTRTNVVSAQDADIPKVVIGNTVQARIISGTSGVPISLDQYAFKIQFAHLEGTQTMWSSVALWNSAYPGQNPRSGTIVPQVHGLYPGLWTGRITLLGDETCQVSSGYIVQTAGTLTGTPVPRTTGDPPIPTVPPTNTPTPIPTLIPIDGACEDISQCAIGLICKDGVCKQGKKLGETCNETTLLCGNRLICVDGKCKSVAKPEQGDTNGDGLINEADLDIWRSEFLGVLGDDLNGDGKAMDADFDRNNKVDLLDLWILIKNKMA